MFSRLRLCLHKETPPCIHREPITIRENPVRESQGPGLTLEPLLDFTSPRLTLEPLIDLTSPPPILRLEPLCGPSLQNHLYIFKHLSRPCTICLESGTTSRRYVGCDECDLGLCRACYQTSTKS
jgi:hypothetical protein